MNLLSQLPLSLHTDYGLLIMTWKLIQGIQSKSYSIGFQIIFEINKFKNNNFVKPEFHDKSIYELNVEYCKGEKLTNNEGKFCKAITCI